MSSKHQALVVEDDPETAEELGEILTALQIESKVVDNREDAYAAITSDGGGLCLVLLDLQIKATRTSLRGNVENGRSLLRDVRRLKSEHVGEGHWLPIIVISGHAREADDAVGAMRDGASDVIQKPPKSGDVSSKIREAFNRAGRSSHAACDVLPQKTPPDEGPVSVVLSGERHKRRCRVLINSRVVELTDGSLRLFLRLLVAHQAGKRVHKIDLGATDDKGFKGVARLREELKPALGSRDIVTNDYQGTYGLVAEVVVAKCDANAFGQLGDPGIASLAKQLKAK